MQNCHFINYSPIQFKAKKENTVVSNTTNTSTKSHFDFTFNATSTLTERSFDGNLNNINYTIKHEPKVFKEDNYIGKINNKAINLKYKKNLSKNKLNGKFDDKPVDLTIEKEFGSYNITGIFNGKNVNFKIKTGFNGYEITNDNANLKIKNNLYYSKDINVKGNYDDDKELMPLLLTIAYDMCEDEVQNALTAMMLV